jgi:hypothetical protein
MVGAMGYLVYLHVTNASGAAWRAGDIRRGHRSHFFTPPCAFAMHSQSSMRNDANEQGGMRVTARAF